MVVVVVVYLLSHVRLLWYHGLPGSSVHGISQARLLEWIFILFSMESSWARHETHISCIAGGFFSLLLGITALFSHPCFLRLPPTFRFPRNRARGSYITILLRECSEEKPEWMLGSRIEGGGAEQGRGFRRSLTSAGFCGTLWRPRLCNTLELQGTDFCHLPTPILHYSAVGCLPR